MRLYWYHADVSHYLVSILYWSIICWSATHWTALHFWLRSLIMISCMLRLDTINCCSRSIHNDWTPSLWIDLEHSEVETVPVSTRCSLVLSKLNTFTHLMLHIQLHAKVNCWMLISADTLDRQAGRQAQSKRINLALIWLDLISGCVSFW